MAKLLTKFIKENKQLIYLDISECGLGEPFLMRVVQAVGVSQTLLSFHLGGNPGVHDISIKHMITMLDAQHDELFDF